MARRVLLGDGRLAANELTASEVVPIGATFTEVASTINTLNGGRGMAASGLNELVTHIAITDTMPAGSEIVITPWVIGFGALDDVTEVLGTVTDDTLANRLVNNQGIRDADFIKITYRFQQGAAAYTVTAINTQLKNAAASQSVALVPQSRVPKRYEAATAPLDIDYVATSAFHLISVSMTWSGAVTTDEDFTVKVLNGSGDVHWLYTFAPLDRMPGLVFDIDFDKREFPAGYTIAIDFPNTEANTIIVNTIYELDNAI